MTSCTSPRDSAYGLPISRVTSLASASLLFSTTRPIFFTTWERIGAGTSDHSRCAARAALHACTNVPASPSSTSATVSVVRAGFVESMRPPGASSTARPPITEATVRVPTDVFSRASVVLILYLQASLVCPSCHYPTPKPRDAPSSKIVVNRAQCRPSCGVSRHGNIGHGHSELGARHPAAHREEDLQPLHSRRYAG